MSGNRATIAYSTPSRARSESTSVLSRSHAPRVTAPAPSSVSLHRKSKRGTTTGVAGELISRKSKSIAGRSSADNLKALQQLSRYSRTAGGGSVNMRPSVHLRRSTFKPYNTMPNFDFSDPGKRPMKNPLETHGELVSVDVFNRKLEKEVVCLRGHSGFFKKVSQQRLPFTVDARGMEYEWLPDRRAAVTPPVIPKGPSLHVLLREIEHWQEETGAGYDDY
eukprot:gnl/MRDRNA2_/MRDRNA2_59340_c0_seq1.p1 gnl/MRDRNA2_/MRDRNA2_59340_c0~~gnl/MRDRNA2_/MRDRNA2_59340_c0_seq1.p1  ORF type:complete len:221 (+),score=32.58 gnl/MRDRNA2_/MRDRNA2_59340_c0_seq1:65-727(+)